MPELPEVETVVRDLRAGGLPQRRIVTARILWPRLLDGGRMSVAAFVRAVEGRRIRGVDRRAKFIVVSLDSGAALLIHLRMSGRLCLTDAPAASDPHCRAWLDLDDNRRLVFTDTRKFGRWILTRTPAAILSRLGPEPLDRSFSAGMLAAGLAAHRRMLKPLLLDQTFLAGLGNIYADEALWAARLHPCRLAHALTAVEARALHGAIRSVLQQGIRLRGTALGQGKGNFHTAGGRAAGNQRRLKVFHRTGQPCPACGASIVRLIVAQRSTHICPRCQPRRAQARHTASAVTGPAVVRRPGGSWRA